MRPNDRKADQVRPIKITRNYTAYAEGSVLVEFGNTKVLCNATVEEYRISSNPHTSTKPLFIRALLFFTIHQHP